MNPYIEIYNNQVGSGLAAFQGVRFQRGHGFFGRIIGPIISFIKQLAPSVGKAILPHAVGLANDAMQGEDFKTAAKNRLTAGAKSAVNTTISHLNTKLNQDGRGYRYKTNNRKRRYSY